MRSERLREVLGQIMLATDMGSDTRAGPYTTRRT